MSNLLFYFFPSYKASSAFVVGSPHARALSLDFNFLLLIVHSSLCALANQNLIFNDSK